jgi:serine/threonine protein kinase
VPHIISIIEPIEPIEASITEFINQINTDYLPSLNAFIADYNNNEGVDDVEIHELRCAQLIEIEKIKNQIENRYPASYFTCCPDYIEKIQKKLCNELYTGFVEYGLKIDNSCELAELIRTLSHEELGELYQALTMGTYSERIKSKLSGYAIECLSRGNNYIFQLTHAARNESFMVRIGDQLNQPRSQAIELGYQTTYLKNPYASRQYSGLVNVRGYDNHRKKVIGLKQGTVIIDVLPFYKNSDLATYHAGIIESQAQDGLLSIIRDYQQMVDILLDLQSKHKVFLDAKLSNWMVDDNGKLAIVDAKSILAVTPELEYDAALAENEGHKHVHSTLYDPPEYASLQFNADKVHAFITGKNLYDTLYSNKNNKKWIASPLGMDLHELIDQMLQRDPMKRITLSQVKAELSYIQQPRLRANALMKIYSSMVEGREGEALIKIQSGKLATLSNDDAIRQFNTVLQNDIKRLEKNKGVNPIKQAVQHGQFNTVFQPLEKNKELDRIKQAVQDLRRYNNKNPPRNNTP